MEKSKFNITMAQNGKGGPVAVKEENWLNNAPKRIQTIIPISPNNIYFFDL